MEVIRSIQNESYLPLCTQFTTKEEPKTTKKYFMKYYHLIVLILLITCGGKEISVLQGFSARTQFEHFNNKVISETARTY